MCELHSQPTQDSPLKKHKISNKLNKLPFPFPSFLLSFPLLLLFYSFPFISSFLPPFLSFSRLLAKEQHLCSVTEDSLDFLVSEVYPKLKRSCYIVKSLQIWIRRCKGLWNGDRCWSVWFTIMAGIKFHKVVNYDLILFALLLIYFNFSLLGISV